jgi:hypothetical protein
LTSALFGLALAAGQFQSPQLRTNLESGAIVLAERMPDAKSLSVQLFASSRGVEEVPSRHGWRHLLEHLILKGRDSKNPIDTRAESKGIFIQGRTFRHAMQIELSAKPEQLDECLAYLKEITQPVSVTAEDIAGEVDVIRQELALMEDSIRLGNGAWTAAYGSRGLGPAGDPAAMAAATPDALESLQSQHFAPANLVLVISGPINVDSATAKATALLSGFRGTPEEAAAATEAHSGRTEVEGAFGEGRAVPVSSLADPKTAAVLIGAFGIATRTSGAFVTYTPNMKQGLVIVGQTEASAGISRLIDDLNESDLGQVYSVGSNLGRRWLENQLKTPAGSATLWGHLLLDRPQGRLDDIRRAFSEVNFDLFRAEFRRFKRENAVTFVGVGQ